MAQSRMEATGIAQALRGILVLAVVVLCFGCQSIPADIATAKQGSASAAAPEWRPGDRWVYRWANTAGNGTRTIEVLETREVSGTRYYVLKSPEDELLNFWTLDLRWAFAVGANDSKVQARVDHPVPWFNWPLEVGRRWDHHGVYEDRGGKREANETFFVAGREIVEVPGGRFETFKIVREGQSVDSDQYWYAPQVRSYVKWILKRGGKSVEEELVEYKPADRLIPPKASSSAK